MYQSPVARGLPGHFTRWIQPMICPESTTVSSEYNNFPSGM